MKIITFIQPQLIPAEIISLCNDTQFPRSRLVTNDHPMLKYLEEHISVEPEEFIEKVSWRAKHRKDGTIVKHVINNTIIYSDTYSYWKIVLRYVDNTRPWTIYENCDYDEETDTLEFSSEYIAYLDYVVLDEEMNYCEQRSNL